MMGIVLVLHGVSTWGLAACPTGADEAVQKDAQRDHRALEHELSARRDAYNVSKTVKFSNEKSPAYSSDNTSDSTGQRCTANDSGGDRGQEKLIPDSQAGRANIGSDQ